MSAILSIEELTVALPPGGDRPHALEDVSLELHRERDPLRGRRKRLRQVDDGAAPFWACCPTRCMPPRDASCSKARICSAFDDEEMRRIRGARIGMIFQEPMTALNPLRTIGDQIGEMFETHTALRSAEIASAGTRPAARRPDPRSRKPRAAPIRMNSPAASASAR